MEKLWSLRDFNFHEKTHTPTHRTEHRAHGTVQRTQKKNCTQTFSAILDWMCKWALQNRYLGDSMPSDGVSKMIIIASVNLLIPTATRMRPNQIWNEIRNKMRNDKAQMGILRTTDINLKEGLVIFTRRFSAEGIEYSCNCKETKHRSCSHAVDASAITRNDTRCSYAILLSVLNFQINLKKTYPSISNIYLFKTQNRGRYEKTSLNCYWFGSLEQ